MAAVPEVLMRLGFADIILWLLTFAIVYGVLSQVELPKNREVRAIIAIVMGFFVLMAAPASLIAILSSMSRSIVVLLLGLFVLLIMLEVMGIEYFGTREKEIEKGKKAVYTETYPFILAHSRAFLVAVIIIAILIFISSGGLNLLGIKLPYNFDVTGSAFFIMILLAIIWIVSEKKKR